MWEQQGLGRLVSADPHQVLVSLEPLAPHLLRRSLVYFPVKLSGQPVCAKSCAVPGPVQVVQEVGG